MKKIYMVAVLLYVLAYLVPLGQRPLVIPDEARYAEIPREMLATGDWIVPRINGVRYFEKPVLGYWVNAAVMKVLGPCPYALRLPFALAAGLTALALFVLLRKAGRQQQALLAAAVLLSTPFVYVICTSGVLDGLLLAWLTGAMAAFYLAYRAEGWQRRGYEVVCGICCGLAFLSKGFLAFAFPAVVIGPFLLWERRWRELFTMAWIPFLTAVLVALPWAIAMQLREPDFWHFFVWNEHIRRFVGEAAQHREAIWFFVPVMLVGAVPLTFIVPAALGGLRQAEVRQEPLVRFALCWLVFPFLFFSVCRGKLATYILPCFPPLAILVAIGLSVRLKQGRCRAFTVGTCVGAVLFVAAAGVLLLNEALDVDILRLPAGIEPVGLATVAVGLLAWSGGLAYAAAAEQPVRRLVSYCVSPVLFMAACGFVVSAEATFAKAPCSFLRKHAAAVTPSTVLCSDKTLIHAVCWAWKRDDVYVVGGPGELKYGLGYPDAARRSVTISEFAELCAATPPGSRVVLVASNKHYWEWRERLPTPIDVVFDEAGVFAEFGSASSPSDDRRALHTSETPQARRQKTQQGTEQAGEHSPAS